MTKTTLTALALALSLSACADAPAGATAPTVVVDDDSADLDDDETEADPVEPPAAVAEAFAAAYPTASAAVWSIEGDAYEAQVTMDGVETSVLYSAAGVAGAVETEIAVATLPAAVTAALARDHAGHPVTEAARIVENGQTTYEAEITVDGTTTDLIFREDGTLVESRPAESD